MNDTDTLSLLEAARQGDNEACEQMLQENVGLIWSVVRRYHGRGVDQEDLFQLGSMGFVKAVRGFDPAYGCQFSTYAVPKIAGEIRRFLRDDGMVKVGRGAKERAMMVRAARDRLNHTLGREPTVSELAAATGLEAEEIAAAEAVNVTVTSLQLEVGEDGFTLEHILGDEGIEDGLVEKVALRAAIEQLPEKERMTVFLRYYKNMTQEQTARILGVSQVQVSRVERRAMERLRGKLE